MDYVHHLLVDIWLCFLALFLSFYVILDGFDLGIGILSLFAREGSRRRIMVASLSSVWDANETWLIVFGGALFGAFPAAYGVALHAMYLPIITMIFALIFRGIAFEFREHARRPGVWDYTFGLGSLLAAVCQGFSLGGLIGGPLITHGRFVGGSFDWLSGFSVVVACGVVFGYVLLGACYLIIKTEGEQQTRSIRTAWIGAALMLGAAAVISAWTPLRYPFVADKWFGHGVVTGFLVPPLVAMFCSAMLGRALWKRQDHAPFVWSAGIFFCSLTGLTLSLSPYLIPQALTPDETAADSPTLVFMMLGIGMLIPVMIAYNAYQYMVFRGKVTGDHYG